MQAFEPKFRSWDDLPPAAKQKIMTFDYHIRRPELMDEVLLNKLYSRVNIWWIPDRISRAVISSVLDILPDTLVERMLELLTGVPDA